MTIAQEEIFGPVLSIIPLRRRGRRRSASPTAPSTGWPARCGRATQGRGGRVRPRGCAPARSTINGGAFNPLAPFGGYKQSGIGRELGGHGLEEYLEIKSLQL